jgi:hypothetical protein
MSEILASDVLSPGINAAAPPSCRAVGEMAPMASCRSGGGRAGRACPSVTPTGDPVAGRRGPPDRDFAIEVCEARAPAATTRLAASGAALPIVPATARRIVVIGDTGCRIEGRAVQDCGNPTAWPFAAIAARAAAKQPELVIHLGDFYYREAACPVGRTGCAGSPFGDNWPTWKAELFDPGAPLLAAAPWIVVRGNHELCSRGGKGWFRLLDPYPARVNCTDRTDPYWLAVAGLSLLMFDNSAADDFLAPPDKVAFYAAQLAPVLAKAPPRAWLAMHRPLWAMGRASRTGMTSNQTMQAAIRGQVPATRPRIVGASVRFSELRVRPRAPGTAGRRHWRGPPAASPRPRSSALKSTACRYGAALPTRRFSYFVMVRTDSVWDGPHGVDDDPGPLPSRRPRDRLP